MLSDSLVAPRLPSLRSGPIRSPTHVKDRNWDPRDEIFAASHSHRMPTVEYATIKMDFIGHAR